MNVPFWWFWGIYFCVGGITLHPTTEVLLFKGKQKISARNLEDWRGKISADCVGTKIHQASTEYMEGKATLEISSKQSRLLNYSVLSK